jgi:polyisoprenoid-binding protein YceI
MDRFTIGPQVVNLPHNARIAVGLVIASHLLCAQGANWKIDPLHSSAQFSVRHMMISTVRGQFGGVRGNIVYDPKNPTAATVEATIDPRSIRAKRSGTPI